MRTRGLGYDVSQHGLASLSTGEQPTKRVKPMAFVRAGEQVGDRSRSTAAGAGVQLATSAEGLEPGELLLDAGQPAIAGAELEEGELLLEASAQPTAKRHKGMSGTTCIQLQMAIVGSHSCLQTPQLRTQPCHDCSRELLVGFASSVQTYMINLSSHSVLATMAHKAEMADADAEVQEVAITVTDLSIALSAKRI